MPKRMSKQEFIDIASDLHKNKYDYSEVDYINSQTKVKIKCPIHGYFFQIPASHILNRTGRGCNQCAKKERGLKYRLTTEQFIEKAKQVHGDRYDYSKVNYIGTGNYVTIICHDHGEFFQTPHSHIGQKSGCPKCKSEKHSILNTMDKDTFIRKSIEKNGNIYDYSKVDYINSETKVSIICHKIGQDKKPHGEFKVTPNNHMSKKSGCPICQESKGERLISKILSEKNIIFERQKQFEGCRFIRKLKFDFYIPHLNLLIEYDGKQHFLEDCFHKNLKKVQLHDSIKDEYCFMNNISLLRLPYTLTEEEIKDKILNATKSTL